jgi:preprotein translocase subunit SecB
MAETTNGAETETASTPRLQVLTQFIRDMSFENIAAQKGLPSGGKPDIKVQVNLDAQKKGEDQYEVALKVKVDSKMDTAQVFILEVDYAGRFLIQNVPDAQLHPLLMIECPRLIFPYLRRIVGDITRDGGYPPMNLDTIDFLALYRAEIERQKATATPTPQEN